MFPHSTVSASSSNVTPMHFLTFMEQLQMQHNICGTLMMETASTQNTSHAYTSTGHIEYIYWSNGNCFDQDQIDITIINTNTGLNEYKEMSLS